MTPNTTPEPNEPPALAALRETVEQRAVIDSPKVIRLTKKPRSAGMFGTSEIAALASSGALLLLILGFYFFWVVPAKTKNRELAAQRDNLETELTTLRTQVKEGVSTQATVDDLVTSVERFEINYLPPQVQGSTKIYERLNGLIHENGLRNVSGPDYAPLEPDTKIQTENTEQTKAGRAKFQSLFPGLYITTTVEGSYANLRRMIQQIEQSGQFVIINTVELEPADSVEKQKVKVDTASKPSSPITPPAVQTVPNFPGNPTIPNGVNEVNIPKTLQQPPQQQPAPTTQTEVERVVKRRKGEIVSLKIEMATYFRRDGAYSANTSANPGGK